MPGLGWLNAIEEDTGWLREPDLGNMCKPWMMMLLRGWEQCAGLGLEPTLKEEKVEGPKHWESAAVWK